MSSDLTKVNDRYGTLTVIEQIENRNSHKRYKVLCDCGNIIEAYGFQMRYNKVVSCGKHIQLEDGSFIKKEVKAKEFHKSSYSPTYKSYQSMLDRCDNPKNKDFKYYGGRGITVAQEWIDSYQAFVEHVGIRPVNTTIDRINVNKNYEPGNVRWATSQVQNSNKRGSSLIALQSIFGQKK